MAIHGQCLSAIWTTRANIISDHNRKFDSNFWRAIFKRLNTMLNLSTVDHPQTHGQTEPVNQLLEDML